MGRLYRAACPCVHNGSPILVIRPSKDGAYDFHVFNPDGAKRQINLWYENEHYEYLQGKALQETKAEWSPAPHHGFRSGVKQRASLAKSVYESSANRTVRTSQPKTAARLPQVLLIPCVAIQFVAQPVAANRVPKLIRLEGSLCDPNFTKNRIVCLTRLEVIRLPNVIR